MINSVFLVGRVVGEPEHGFSPSGQPYCGFYLSTRDNIPPDATSAASALRCVAFGSQAQRLQDEVPAGSVLMIIGILGTRKYTCGCGAETFPMEVVVSQIEVGRDQ